MKQAEFREKIGKLKYNLMIMEANLSRIYKEERGWKTANKRSRLIATALRKQFLEWKKISMEYEKQDTLRKRAMKIALNEE